MKKIYTLIIVLVLAQQPVFSQYGQFKFDFGFNFNFSNIDYSKINFPMNTGNNYGFGNFDFSIGIPCCESENYKFGGTNFTQLNAGFQYEAAKKAALDNWYSAQRVLIKTEIDKYFNKTFANYKEAVNATFIDYGKSNHKNFDYNLRNLKNKQIAISDDYKPQNKIKLIDLKLLQLRRQEINAGNINNSEYPYSKVNGIPLKDYRTINSINVNWNAIKTNLIPNLAKQQNANYFSIALNNLDSSFDTYLLNLQRTFYDGNLNHGQRLFLEQFCINILMAYRINPNAFRPPNTSINYDIPDGLERGPLFMPTGTAEILQNYLNMYAETSVFDADYYLKVLDEILINNGWEPVYGDTSKVNMYIRYAFLNIANAQALERRNAELNRLVNEVVIKPCAGDPVANPEIAPQYGSSGIKGALHGCTRFGSGCSGLPGGRTKSHIGIDIKAKKNSPIFALFDDIIHINYTQNNKAGHVTRIRSELPNGKIIIYQYFHLKENSRLLVGSEVKAGDIIAYLGDSGNLKKAIFDGDVDSHVHIKMNLYDGSGNSNDYSTNFKNNPVNPSVYMNTKFDSEGNKIENNCN
jgi:hypothetical protein